MEPDRKHCQICERLIKVKVAVVASKSWYGGKRVDAIVHHGYQRPGDGWQTPSCYGARHLPAEVSNDAMQPYIDMVSRYVASRESYLDSIMANPPETLTGRAPWGKPSPVHSRPTGFNPKANEKAGSWGYGQHYEYAFHELVSNAEREIRSGKREIKRMTVRVANWKPAAI